MSLNKEIKEKAKVESLLLSEELTKHLKPTIASLNKGLDDVVKPITVSLRNELKENIRGVDRISNDLEKKLSALNQLLKQLEKTINNSSSTLTESISSMKGEIGKMIPELAKQLDESAKALEYNLNQELVPQLKNEIHEFVKSISHGLINDIRQATESERAQLKHELEQLITRTENAIIKLQADEAQSVPQKIIVLMKPIITTVLVTLLTLSVYQGAINPLNSLSDQDKRTYATGALFEKAWGLMTPEQKQAYRNITKTISERE